MDRESQTYEEDYLRIRTPRPISILRLDITKPRRASLESRTKGIPPSPQPSIDRLSVTFAEDSLLSDTSTRINLVSSNVSPIIMEKINFPGNTDEENSDEEDYSASVTAILQRRASTKRSKKRGSSRRASSSFSPDIVPGPEDGRRRSSVFTTSSGDTAISMDDSLPVVSEAQVFENIRLHKEVLKNVKLQPWSMRKKMRLVEQAKSYIKQHEGVLQERLAQSHSTRDILASLNIWLIKKLQHFKRESANFSNWVIPWELRIKEIESHFGSVVASYFIFLRWLFWVNLVIAVILIAFVAVPELLTADLKKAGAEQRKLILPEEKYNSTNFLTLWDFEGVFKYSPLFYGWYTKYEGPGEVYRLPLAYFITGLSMYAYSFIATLRKMAKNSRMSKLSEKADECIFSWKLFTGWDYMIGNAETAQNRVASIIMSLKEALVEEAEKKRDAQNWKVIGSRILVNINVIGLLILSAYAVIQVVQRSTEPEANSSTWRRNEITVVMSLISLFFPILFELLGFFEHYHPRKQLRLQLARIMVLNLLNLYSLIFALFGKIGKMSQDLQTLRPNNTYALSTISNTLSPAVTRENPMETQTEFTNQIYTICYDSCNNAITNPATTIASIVIAVTGTLLTLNISNSNVTEEIFSYNFHNESTTEYFHELDTFSENSNTTDFDTLIRDSDYLQEQLDQFNDSTTNTPHFEKRNAIMNYTDFFNTPESMNNSMNFSYELFKTTVVPMLNITYNEDWIYDERFEETLSSLYNEVTEIVTQYQWNNNNTMENCTSYCNDSETIPSSNSSSSSKSADIYSYSTNFDSDYKDRKRLRSLCWETMFGQELVKLTVMDLVLMVLSTFAIDFFRGIFVRVMNHCWCWDLEKKFPQYGDFKVAENILHLVNNQGMVWMGMFFSPGLVVLNIFKLYAMMYLRSWAVMTCNVPHEVIFRASRSNNFYFALLLMMLFLCVLPVGYTIVWLEPSWHCGPFSEYRRIFHIFTKTLRKVLPESLHNLIDYIASPGIVIPLLLLMALVIYYLISLTNALRESNNDLKIQLRRERTEERRKMFQIVDRRRRGGSDGSNEFPNNPMGKWRKLLKNLQKVKSFDETPRTSEDLGVAPILKSDILEKVENSVKTKREQKVIKTEPKKQKEVENVNKGKKDVVVVTEKEKKIRKPNEIISKFLNLRLLRRPVAYDITDGYDTEQPDSLQDDVRSNPDISHWREQQPSPHSGGGSYYEDHENNDNLSELSATNKADTTTTPAAAVHKYRRVRRDIVEYSRRSNRPSTSKETNCCTREDSIRSNWSENNIPVIRISKTESTEILADAKQEDSASSNVVTYRESGEQDEGSHDENEEITEEEYVAVDTRNEREISTQTEQKATRETESSSNNGSGSQVKTESSTEYRDGNFD